MLIILVTVLTQGPLVDHDLRGDLKGLLFANDGFFQAVGVISFGMSQFLRIAFSNAASICMPP